MAEVKSLEELCFIHIAMTLEEYTVNDLALLPKAFREHLLHTIPVVDVCRLEGTQFTKDLDMESIWEEVFSKHLQPGQSSRCVDLGWREEFFDTLTSLILSGRRPYGYFLVIHRGQPTYTGGVQITRTRHVVTEEGLAERCAVDTVNYLLAMKSSHSRLSDKKTDTSRSSMSLTVHWTIDYNGLSPPGKVYNEACRARQLVPPRYTKLFPEGSCYLPDSTALELISRECHYRPKRIKANNREFNTLFLRLEQERGNHDVLREVFGEVESFTLNETMNFETQSVTRKILELVDTPKLTDLSVTDNTIQSDQQTTFKNLKMLVIKLVGKLSNYCEKHLLSITKRQASLHEVSLTISRDNSQQVIPWLEICFKKPSIKHVHLDIELMPRSLHLKIVETFLLTPNSSEQTLKISGSIPFPPPSNPKTYHFDDTVTQNKCIEASYQYYSKVLTVLAGYTNRPLRLKKLIVLSYGGEFLRTLPDLHLLLVEELEINGTKGIDYSTLLQKKSLQKVTFKNCTGINDDHICSVAYESGFELVVGVGTYTLIRN